MSFYADWSHSYHVIHYILVSNSYVDWKWKHYLYTNNYVDIAFTNEVNDVEFYDEDKINKKIYDDKPPTNKASLDDG